METTFSLDISVAELGWLAGAFGVAQLPLSSPGTIVLDDGRRELRKRGLIQPAERGGWQVDPLAAMAVRWMAEARYYWVFEQYQKSAIPRQIPLFFREGAVLLVLPSGDEKRLVICQDKETALMEWRLSVRLPFSADEENLPEWDVPQPVTIIRSNWRNPLQAQKMANADFLDWASSLEWAGEWVLVNEGRRSTRLVMAARGRSCWGGVYTPGRPGEFILRKFFPQELNSIISDTSRTEN